MIHPPTIIERAFALAATGEHPNIESIIQALKREGFDKVQQHFAGPGIRSDLRQISATAKVRRAN